MGDARYGRRDNGLVAAEYVPAGDVDPRVGEHLLDVLARDGIAAYLRPSIDQPSITPTTPSQRPVDRLYVDRAHVATARDHLARLAREEREAETGATDHPATSDHPAVAGSADAGPETPTGARTPTDPGTATDPNTPANRVTATDPGVQTNPATAANPAVAAGASAPTDAATPTGGVPGPRSGRSEPTPEEVDRAFAEIVAGLGDTLGSDATLARDIAADPLLGRPDGTELGPSRPDRRRKEPEPAPEEGSLLDALDTFGADLPDDDPGTFVPPDPPPVPRPALPTVLAVTAVVGGLAVFLQPQLLSFVAEGLAMFFGFALVVGGSAALVWRLRPGSEEDTDPDHGAKV